MFCSRFLARLGSFGLGPTLVRCADNLIPGATGAGTNYSRVCTTPGTALGSAEMWHCLLGGRHSSRSTLFAETNYSFFQLLKDLIVM